MNHRPTRHPPSLNFISPVPPTKPSNAIDDDDDVSFLCSVPKVPHTPEEYDPECKCSTCQLATKLLAECTCIECRGKQQANQVNHQAEGQVVLDSKNVKMFNQEKPPNCQPSKSFIQNNAASTSERMNGNDQDDGRESKSSTPDNVAQLFDDESSSSSSDSSSEDSEDDNSVDVEVDDKELSQESNDNANEYAFSRPSKSFKKSSAKGHQGKHTKTIDSKKSHKCPSCNERFSATRKLKRHYREQHQQLKRKESVTIVTNRTKTSRSDCPHCGRNVHPQLKRHLLSHKNVGFRCVWPNCGFFYSQLPDAKKHVSVDHLRVEQATSLQTNQHLVKVDPSTGKTEKVVHRASAISTAFNSNCPKCNRNFRNGGLFKQHLGTHTKSGFRCTWRECGFFFSGLASAKQHILSEHFKGKLVNSKQINEHLVKVEPKKKRRDQERKPN